MGADKPEDAGEYYAWGELESKFAFNPENYIYNNAIYSDLIDKTVIDIEGNLTSKHDVAIQKLGDAWHTPTYKEMEELCDKCIWNWTNKNGKKGYEVTGPNGNSIFLPATGLYTENGNTTLGTRAFYWSSSTSDCYSSLPIGLVFAYDYHTWSNQSGFVGCSIRPVTSKECSDGIYSIPNEANDKVNVYSINGQMVRKAVKAEMSLDGLPSGIFITNGKKYIIK